MLVERLIVVMIIFGVGFEVVLWECIVYCYGVVFYFNWGFIVDYVFCDCWIVCFKVIDVVVEIMIN